MKQHEHCHCFITTDVGGIILILLLGTLESRSKTTPFLLPNGRNLCFQRLDYLLGNPLYSWPLIFPPELMSIWMRPYPPSFLMHFWRSCRNSWVDQSGSAAVTLGQDWLKGPTPIVTTSTSIQAFIFLNFKNNFHLLLELVSLNITHSSALGQHAPAVGVTTFTIFAHLLFSSV